MPFISHSTLKSFSLLWLVTTCAAAQGADFDWDALKGSDNLTWVECYTGGAQCARFNVPLNYSDPNGGTGTLAMIRIPSNLSSTDPGYRGPVLVNPGGPGGSGIDFVVGLGQQISAVLGPSFDLVSFDPRGVGRSTPTISFFASDAEKAFWNLGNGNARSVNGTTVADGLPRLWAQSQVLGQLAKDHDTGILPYATTDNVARDMLRIVEAHNQTKLQYYGFSYGTALGATFATMFPDRVERLIIDGVLDMDAYFSNEWSPELKDTEKDLQMFFDGCHAAGPDACPFFADSSAEISQNLFNLLESVRANPVPVYDSASAAYGIIDYATLKQALEGALYQPFQLFSVLGQGLALLQSGNGSVILQMTSPPTFGNTSTKSYNNELEAEIAISCGDTPRSSDTPASLFKYFDSIKNISTAVDMVMAQRIHCSGWKVHTDHFAGPVGSNTSFPLLLIGNTADPVTPLAAAKKTSKSFPGSVVLTQDCPGHTSLSASSACTIGYIQQYLQNGTLPPADTVCKVDAELFPSTNDATTNGATTNSAAENKATLDSATRRALFRAPKHRQA